MHLAGPAHVRSRDAIKSRQNDPWVMDERRRKEEEEGGFSSKGSFKSVALSRLSSHCGHILLTSPLEGGKLKYRNDATFTNVGNLSKRYHRRPPD